MENVRNYKKIIKYNQPSNTKYKIDSFPELGMHLAVLGITPQEAFNIINKSKNQYNARFYWTMTRIAFYVNARWSEYEKRLKKKLTDATIEIKKMKKFSNHPIYEDFSFKERSRFINSIYGSLMKREDGKEKAKDIFYIKLPKKIDTCKKVVDSKEFKNEFKNFYPLEKFDARKEAQNLNKLTTEKRHQDKLTKGDFDIAINKPMKQHAWFCKNFKNEKYYSYPQKYFRNNMFKSVGIFFKEVDIKITYRKKRKQL